MRCAAATCGAVRQFAASAPVHCRTAGSKVQVRGSLTTPSTTPSFASHAATMAVFSTVSFAATIAVASCRKGWLFHSSPAIRFIHCQPGAPATMPS